MIYILTFILSIILVNSLISLKKYSKFNLVFKRLDFYRFQEYGRLKIANHNSKDEFVMISDWKYKIGHNLFLQFDMWSLIDLHKLYWLVKFNSKLKDLNNFKYI